MSINRRREQVEQVCGKTSYPTNFASAIVSSSYVNNTSLPSASNAALAVSFSAMVMTPYGTKNGRGQLVFTLENLSAETLTLYDFKIGELEIQLEDRAEIVLPGRSKKQLRVEWIPFNEGETPNFTYKSR